MMGLARLEAPRPLPRKSSMSRIGSTLLALVKIGVVVGLLGVFFVASGYLAVKWALSGEVLEVPTVVGMPEEDARARLRAQGLTADLADGRLPDPAVPEGAVLRQNPPAGSSVKHQRSVRLILSAGPPARPIPDTSGEVVTRARIALEQQDVTVAWEARVHSPEVTEDRVISQQPDTVEPEPGNARPPARLLVSMGARPRIWVMPDLLSRPIDEVRPFLQARGFRLAPPRTAQQRGVRPGVVINQIPSPGYPIRAGETIQLTVSQ